MPERRKDLLCRNKAVLRFAQDDISEKCQRLNNVTPLSRRPKYD